MPLICLKRKTAYFKACPVFCNNHIKRNVLLSSFNQSLLYETLPFASLFFVSAIFPIVFPGTIYPANGGAPQDLEIQFRAGCGGLVGRDRVFSFKGSYRSSGTFQSGLSGCLFRRCIF